MLNCPEAPSQAALFLSHGFKSAMKATLGLPIYVALPNQGSLYLIPAKNKSQIPKLRDVVMQEFKSGSHPLTTEVFEVSEKSISVFTDLGAER